MSQVNRATRASAADQTLMRRQNLSVLMTQLRDAGPHSRAKLAAATALNKATVSSLILELVERGLVVEGDVATGEIGRPAQSLRLSTDGLCGIGVEVGVTSVTVVALDLGRNPVASRRSTAVSDTDVDGSVAVVAELVHEVAAELAPRAIAGLCLALPVPVNTKSGTVHPLPGHPLGDVAVADMVAERVADLGLDVHVDNEANLAAMAEVSLRPGIENLVVLTGSIGVGAGIVVGGRLVRGFSGFGGEAGHMPVELQGGLCACGRRGCWETRVGLDALLRGLAEIDDPILSNELDAEQRLAEIVRRAEASDQRTLISLEQVGTWIGVGAATLANVVDPEVFILGGYFAAIAPWLVGPIQGELDRRALGASQPGYRLEASSLRTLAAAHGAAVVALEPVFNDPTSVPRMPVDRVGA